MVDLNKGATVELVKALSDDIRTLPDGMKAASAGDAVRGQVSALQNITRDIKAGASSLFKRKSAVYFAIRGHLLSNGYIDATGTGKTICIPVSAGDEIYIKGTSVEDWYYTFLTSNTIVLGSPAPLCNGYNRIVIHGSEEVKVTAPNDAAFIMVQVTNNSNTYLFPQKIAINNNSVLIDDLEQTINSMQPVVDELDKEVNGYTVENSGENCLISDTGIYYFLNGLGKHVCIPVSSGDIVKFIGNEIQTGVYAFLTSNEVIENEQAPFCEGYEGRILLYANEDTTISIPIDCNYLYVAFTNFAGANISPSKIFINDKLVNKPLSERLKNENNVTQWLSNLITAEPNGNIIHFSFDDIYIELKDLITNSSNYTSIWDSPYFSKLKTAHDNTGCCITLNCFTDINGFKITDLPIKTTWQSELQTAKTWLRFSFHAKSDAHYNGASQLADYNDFINGIYRLTGSYECIDRVARLGYFEGSYSAIEELKALEYGVIGLLTADSEGRLSYDFTNKEANHVWKRGRYFDTDKEMIFIKTLPRFDNNSAQDIIDTIVNDTPFSTKMVEVFGHAVIDETNMAKIAAIASWANNNNYIHAFPMDIYVD